MFITNRVIYKVNERWAPFVVTTLPANYVATCSSRARGFPVLQIS